MGRISVVQVYNKPKNSLQQPKTLPKVLEIALNNFEINSLVALSKKS